MWFHVNNIQESKVGSLGNLNIIQIISTLHTPLQTEERCFLRQSLEGLNKAKFTSWIDFAENPGENNN
jgi:hypothetical protein